MTTAQIDRPRTSRATATVNAFSATKASASLAQPATSNGVVDDAFDRVYTCLTEANVVLEAAGSTMHRDAVWGIVRLVSAATDRYFEVTGDTTVQRCEDLSQSIAEVEDLLKIICEWDDDARLLSAGLTLVRLAQHSVQEGIFHLQAANRNAAAAGNVEMQEHAR
ncbi:hypothetical protein [uncultured Xylophilus sp.]|uniref:hypothetical protein n=1 Tax=uncultured Xylophilus sp. TaxID=296832 RepID=UPI0025FA1516|nr:hypothetical protein [uncultured Xylophilus sp.]